MKNLYFDWANVPLILTVADVASLLHISRAAAYSLCHTKGFPTSAAEWLLKKIIYVNGWPKTQTPKTYHLVYINL